LYVFGHGVSIFASITMSGRGFVNVYVHSLHTCKSGDLTFLVKSRSWTQTEHLRDVSHVRVNLNGVGLIMFAVN
jgi:uncharacterized protein YifN (PemK superfamily)